MWKNPEIFTRAVETAQNHFDRAREGQVLLEQGRSIGEMKTPLIGLSMVQTLERRSEYLAFINQMDDVRLRKHLGGVEAQINNALKRVEKGTSELEWQRNAIRQLLGQY